MLVDEWESARGGEGVQGHVDRPNASQALDQLEEMGLNTNREKRRQRTHRERQRGKEREKEKLI